jgi:hypothetical protein
MEYCFACLDGFMKDKKGIPAGSFDSRIPPKNQIEEHYMCMVEGLRNKFYFNCNNIYMLCYLLCFFVNVQVPKVPVVV